MIDIEKLSARLGLLTRGDAAPLTEADLAGLASEPAERAELGRVTELIRLTARDGAQGTARRLGATYIEMLPKP